MCVNRLELILDFPTSEQMLNNNVQLLPLPLAESLPGHTSFVKNNNIIYFIRYNILNSYSTKKVSPRTSSYAKAK